MGNRLFFVFYKPLGPILLLVLLCQPVLSQERDKGTTLIEKLIGAGETAKAEQNLAQQLAIIYNSKKYDSIPKYISLLGKIAYADSSKPRVKKKLGAFLKQLGQKKVPKSILLEAFIETDDFLSQINENQEALNIMLEAADILQKHGNAPHHLIGRVNYTVGGAYHRLYDLAKAKPYFEKAVAAYEKSSNTEKHTLADGYNALAIVNWDLGDLDSARVNFEKALTATEESDLEPYGKLFYQIVFQFNIALLLDSQGNLNEAIKVSEQVLDKCHHIIKDSNDEDLVRRAKELQSLAVSNLAAYYHDVGFLSRSHQLVKIAYKKKKEVFGQDHPRTIGAIKQLSESYFSLREYGKALELAQREIALLGSSSGQDALKAEGLNHLANIYAAMDSIGKAKEAYDKSNSLFAKAFGKNYSRNHRIHLRDFSDFLSKTGNHELAQAYFSKVYKYNLKNGPDNFPLFKDMLNLAEINFNAGKFNHALEWVAKGKVFLKSKLGRAKNKIDSLQIEFYRPNLILLEAKTKYAVFDNPTEKELLLLTDNIKKAISVLEGRKHLVSSVVDISNLISEYQKITDFGKVLYKDLFEKTKNKEYLDDLLGLNESGIYYRVRERLKIKSNLSFAKVPKQVLKREEFLKSKLSGSLDLDKENNVRGFFQVEREFNGFLDSLRTTAPGYYHLRYSNISESLGGFRNTVPKNTDIIRYMFVKDKLYAYVVNSRDDHLIPLDFDKHEPILVPDLKNNFDDTSNLLHRYYKKLWAPLERYLISDKIIIVPDGALFNLSFELLTPEKINDLQEFATKSLLAKYDISYNYSLLLLDNKEKPLYFEEDFVAFVPGFDKSMKQCYELAITDSTNLDKTYLTLLPQPFNSELAQKFSKRLNGNSFLNDRATKQLFSQGANEHKIIHIGTHAESNNINPELSRLVFAKNVSDSVNINNNYLYAYEIYNQNLNSNLAILTACETGKPHYQPGEGMISLAHAFNYAGSESILTSLWQIDEKSSSQILGYFYGYLEEGKRKDKALTLAKLDYLKTAGGRTLHPQYWAGLILMGDTSPIVISQATPIYVWMTPLLVVLLFFIWMYYGGKSKKGK